MLNNVKSADGRIIGIDVSSLPYGTGVSNYTLNLVRHLIKIDRKNTYKLFFSSFRQPLPSDVSKLKQFSNVQIYHFRLPPSFFQLIWNRLHILPIELFIGQCHIFHTWDWTQPPSLKAKLITTIHDFVPILFPQTQHPKTIKNFKSKMYWAAKECAGFICVSQNTYHDLIKLLPNLDSKKVVTIFEAAEDKYDQFRKLSPANQKAKINIIDRQYDLSKYVLAQGTREPRKNLDRLIQAFTLYKKKNPSSTYELAIAGKYGWGNDVTHIKNPYIKILGFIPEKDMVALHAGAVALCYPSIYEGFGLPLIKSMKLGVPVITANTSSLPEVVGNAALLVDPLNVNDIADKLSQLLSNISLRQKLSRRGLKQASKFSWTKTAKETLDFYNSLIC